MTRDYTPPPPPTEAELQAKVEQCARELLQAQTHFRYCQERNQPRDPAERIKSMTEYYTAKAKLGLAEEAMHLAARTLARATRAKKEDRA